MWSWAVDGVGGSSFFFTSLGFVPALPFLFSLLLLPMKVFLPNVLLGVTSGHSLPCGSGPIQSFLDSYTSRVEGAFGCHPLLWLGLSAHHFFPRSCSLCLYIELPSEAAIAKGVLWFFKNLKIRT